MKVKIPVREKIFRLYIQDQFIEYRKTCKTYDNIRRSYLNLPLKIRMGPEGPLGLLGSSGSSTDPLSIGLTLPPPLLLLLLLLLLLPPPPVFGFSTTGSFCPGIRPGRRILARYLLYDTPTMTFSASQLASLRRSPPNLG